MGRSIGGIINISFKEYFQNIKIIGILFIIFYLMPNIIIFLITGSIPTDLSIQENFSGINDRIGLAPGLFIVSIILAIFMNSCLFYAVTKENKGKVISFKESIKGGSKYFWKYSLLMIMGIVLTYFILAMIGAVLVMPLYTILAIPAVILAVYLSLSPYFLIREGVSLRESIEKSMQLIKSNKSWWNTFGVILLVGALMLSILIVFKVFKTLFPIPNTNLDIGIIGFIINSIASMIIYPLYMLILKNHYLNLKGEFEGLNDKTKKLALVRKTKS